MNASYLRRGTFIGAFVFLITMNGAAFAQKKYDAGVTDTEIKIGNFAPYSGPASAFGVIGKTEEAYFKKINAEGGINGRKIKFISYDDGYSPPKAVEQARRLVEDDEVLLLFHTVGTASNSAIQRYMNSKKVPQLFVASGAAKWNDPHNFPWSMGWQPDYLIEGRIYAKYLLKEKPEARIGVLYQNDDFGKDYLKGLKEGLGPKASMIAAEESYEITEPTMDSHVVKLKSLNIDTFVDVTTPKFAAQVIKKAAEIGWKPFHILNNNAISIGSVLKPAGLENAQGFISVAYLKDPSDERWKDDPGMKAYTDFLQAYLPEANRSDILQMYGYSAAQTLVHVLKACGDDLTRDNVMKQAASIKDLQLGGLLPGIKLNTSPSDFAPIEQLQMMKFSGDHWQLFGDVIDGGIAAEPK
jgi:branched-chain amino acid transport system substrate-binding protein